MRTGSLAARADSERPKRRLAEHAAPALEACFKNRRLEVLDTCGSPFSPLRVIRELFQRKTKSKPAPLKTERSGARALLDGPMGECARPSRHRGPILS